eukprot:12333821-Heterocapsa_arctica.AAC.1
MPPSTVVGIPHAFRAQMCDITAALLEGMNADDATSALLEEARSKLLLAHVPRGDSKPHEFRARFAEWRAGEFGTLLRRVEDQRERANTRRASTSAEDRAARSRRLARGGARRKAVQTLVSDVATLTPAEQRRWAAELLPRAGPAAGAPLPALAPAEVAADALNDAETSPLKGVRFGPLSGPGPSGARPEHLRDMLSCGRRRPANRLLNALRITEALAEAGLLPDAWIATLRTRLVYLRKRRGTKPRPVRVGEMWRRAIAKNKLSRAAAPIRRAMLRAQQFA